MQSINNEDIYVFNIPHLILSSPTSSGTNKVIIVQNGSIHIEGDLISTDGSKLGLIAYNTTDNDEPFKSAHVYIGPDTKQINANIFVDGSLFSAKNYTSVAAYNEYGEPIDIDSSDYPKVFNNQLIIKGSLSSRNCIDCVDSAVNYFYTPRDPLKDITNAENEAIAKKYDLNYLRYFSQGIIFDDNPIDLQCMKPLTTEDLAAISGGETVIGSNGKKCDGIKSDKSYKDGGDLAVLNKDTAVEKYLEEIEGSSELVDTGILDAPIYTTTKPNPLYIEFSPPDPKSFIFGEEKDLTFW